LNRPARQDPLIELLAEFSERLEGGRFRPAVDVYETEKEVVVQVELAGVRREDVRVTVDGGVLRIRGARGPTRDESIQRLHQVEIVAGPFERVLRINLPFDAGAVRASLEEGLLRIRLPKQGPAPRRRIEVEG
jgi:HSP20 family protein